MGIQGNENPGYTPLQNSGQGGPGYTANIQQANSDPSSISSGVRLGVTHGNHDVAHPLKPLAKQFQKLKAVPMKPRPTVK